MNPEVQFVCGTEGFRLRRLLVLAFTATLALRYCMAAQRDEKNGFPFTAAMEWHKAADLFVPIGPVADLCWRRWERIVQLPRQMAVPISDQPRCDASSSQHPVPAQSGNEFPILIAA